MQKLRTLLWNNRKKLAVAAAAVFAAAALLCAVYYALLPSRGYFHSDCSDSILWAKAAIDDGSIISGNYNYSALLPFGGQQIFELFIRLFGVTMKAQVLSMAVFIVIFAAGAFFLLFALGFDVTGSLFASGMLLLVCASSIKMREIFFSHVIYYSLSICLMCFIGGLFALVCRALRNGKYGAALIVPSVLLAALCFMTAFDGVQILALTIVPVAGAAVLTEFCRPKKLSGTELGSQLPAIVGICFFAVAGLVVKTVLFGKVKAAYADAYTVSSFISTWEEHIRMYIKEYLYLIGGVDSADSLLSFRPMRNAVVTLVALVLNAAPIAAFAFWKKLRLDATRRILWLNLIVSGVIMFGYVCGALNYANWRLSPMVCTQVIATCAVLYEMIAAGTAPRRFGVVAMCALLLFGALQVRDVAAMKPDNTADNKYYRLADILTDNGLTVGYATYWNCMTVEIISDSAIDMAPIDVRDDGAHKYYYQSYKDDFDGRKTGNYFVILTTDEHVRWAQTDSYSAFESIVTDAFTFDDLAILVCSEDPGPIFI